MEYTIVIGTTAIDLIKNVNSHIGNGWTPLGGPIVVENSIMGGYKTDVWYQAMTLSVS